MTLPLTPEILAASYGFLRATPPFCRWKLPPADVVEFRVIRNRKIHGDHSLYEGRHRIRISEGAVAHTDTLVLSMAHEMIHVKLDSEGVKSEHGSDFHRLAKLVCKYHGFDPKMF
jgi:hypothetical protein